jgi:hypothetical protein
MALAGTRIEPTLANAAEVHAATHSATLGAIPADRPVSAPEVIARRQLRLRRVLVFLGAAGVAATPAIAYYAIAVASI